MSDSIGLYLNDIGKVPLLNAEDERTLSKAIEAGRAAEAKLKKGGGHAGHNGLRDIHAQLGSPDYWRLRIGIGHPGNKNEVANWVLKKPSPDDRIAIAQALDRSLKALPQLIAGEMDKATALIHTSKPPRPKPPRPAPAADQAEGPPSAVKD